MKKTLFQTLAASIVVTASVQASTNVFNFDEDPSGILNVTRGGDNGTLTAMAGVWFPSNGSTLEAGVGDQSTNGYFAITQTTSDPMFTAHGMRSVIIFDDFDVGLVVAGFTFTCDVRIGAGSDTPADGFSLNYARDTDPALTGGNFSSGPDNNPPNAPEEGTTTGLAISFDAFANSTNDPIGLTLKVDGTVITNIARPTLNGVCADATSLQTGTNTGGLGGLCWQPLFVQLTAAGLLNVGYKGISVLTNFHVPFDPSPGRLVFAGRTGGAWQEQDVDNIRIVTVPATKPVIAILAGDANANGFRYTITDSGVATPDTNTITLQLDGVAVTPTSIIRNPPITLVSYQNPNLLLAVGPGHTASIQFTGTGFSGADTGTNAFTVPAYTLLTPAHQAPAAVNTSLSGYAGRVHQLPIARFPDAGSLIGIERQLADGFIDPNTGQPYASTTANGVSNFIAEVINWSQDVPIAGGQVGDFRSDAAPPADWADNAIPGVDANVNPNTDNVAAELLTILDLPVGAYQLGVLHDDGFKLSFGSEPRDVFKAAVLATDASAVDTTGINFAVTNAGKYPFRLVWGENGGGAQLELYRIDFSTGQKVLINNRTNPIHVVAYRDTAALTQPFVRWVNPAPGETGVNPDTAITVKLEDGSAASITDASISIQLNGSGTATHTRSGGEVTATLASPATLASGSTATATLIYSTSAGGPFTNTWTFVTSPYQILPTSVRTAVASGDATKPGFSVKAWQLSANFLGQTNGFVLPAGGNNDLNFWIAVAQRLWEPNAASSASYDETGVINYSLGSEGSIQPDSAFPFLPGTDGGNDNDMLEAVAFLEFPSAGFYTMGVQSDDGFEVTVGDSHGSPDLVKVTAPAGIARNYGAYPIRGHADAALFPPVSGRVIKANPLDMGGANSNLIVNASAFKGNIVMFHRFGPNNTGGGNNTARFNVCEALGARGVIEVVETNQFPFSLAPTNTTPCVQLFVKDGDTILAQCTDNTSSPVFATIGGGDQAQVLGSFNGGRGYDTPTRFGIYVTQAGVYPLRLLWQNGGGGAGVEWWTETTTGTRMLINGTDTGALKAYRARTVTGGAPVLARPVVSGTNVVLSWSNVGELQQAGSVGGPYYRAPDLNRPQTNAASGSARFFRIRQY